eukprot:2190518-Ditylum_brightwellii.AAC.1
MRGMHPGIVLVKATMWDCITPCRQHIHIGGCFNLGRQGWTAIKMPDDVYDAPSYDDNAFDKDVLPNTGADQQPPPQGNNTTPSDDNNNANTSYGTESQSGSTPPHNAHDNNNHSTQHNDASSNSNTAGGGADCDGTPLLPAYLTINSNTPPAMGM